MESDLKGSVCRNLDAGYPGMACADAQGVCDPEVAKSRAMMSQKSKAWKVRSEVDHMWGLGFVLSALGHCF